MDLEIDPESRVPIYIQIVDRIKQMVVSGRLRPGQQLPTIRQLAADLRINYNTVGRAYVILDQEGVISTQQGRGTFIASRLNEQEIEQIRQQKLRAILGSTVHEALVLGYSRQEIETTLQEELSKTALVAEGG